MAPKPKIITVVEPIPGVFDLNAYFDALFALAMRLEQDAIAQPRRAA